MKELTDPQKKFEENIFAIRDLRKKSTSRRSFIRSFKPFQWRWFYKWGRTQSFWFLQKEVVRYIENRYIEKFKSQNTLEKKFSVAPLNNSCTEAVVQRCSVKEVFLEISKNSQENTCTRVTFLKKRLWHKCCLPVNFAKFLRTPFS